MKMILSLYIDTVKPKSALEATLFCERITALIVLDQLFVYIFMVYDKMQSSNEKEGSQQQFQL